MGIGTGKNDNNKPATINTIEVVSPKEHAEDRRSSSSLYVRQAPSASLEEDPIRIEPLHSEPSNLSISALDSDDSDESKVPTAVEPYIYEEIQIPLGPNVPPRVKSEVPRQKHEHKGVGYLASATQLPGGANRSSRRRKKKKIDQSIADHIPVKGVGRPARRRRKANTPANTLTIIGEEFLNTLRDAPYKLPPLVRPMNLYARNGSKANEVKDKLLACPPIKRARAKGLGVDRFECLVVVYGVDAIALPVLNDTTIKEITGASGLNLSNPLSQVTLELTRKGDTLRGTVAFLLEPGMTSHPIKENNPKEGEWNQFDKKQARSIIVKQPPPVLAELSESLADPYLYQEDPAVVHNVAVKFGETIYTWNQRTPGWSLDETCDTLFDSTPPMQWDKAADWYYSFGAVSNKHMFLKGFDQKLDPEQEEKEPSNEVVDAKFVPLLELASPANTHPAIQMSHGSFVADIDGKGEVHIPYREGDNYEEAFLRVFPRARWDLMNTSVSGSDMVRGRKIITVKRREGLKGGSEAEPDEPPLEEGEEYQRVETRSRGSGVSGTMSQRIDDADERRAKEAASNANSVTDDDRAYTARVLSRAARLGFPIDQPGMGSLDDYQLFNLAQNLHSSMPAPPRSRPWWEKAAMGALSTVAPMVPAAIGGMIGGPAGFLAAHTAGDYLLPQMGIKQQYSWQEPLYLQSLGGFAENTARKIAGKGGSDAVDEARRARDAFLDDPSEAKGAGVMDDLMSSDAQTLRQFEPPVDGRSDAVGFQPAVVESEMSDSELKSPEPDFSKLRDLVGDDRGAELDAAITGSGGSSFTLDVEGLGNVDVPFLEGQSVSQAVQRVLPDVRWGRVNSPTPGTSQATRGSTVLVRRGTGLRGGAEEAETKDTAEEEVKSAGVKPIPSASAVTQGKSEAKPTGGSDPKGKTPSGAKKKEHEPPSMENFGELTKKFQQMVTYNNIPNVPRRSENAVVLDTLNDFLPVFTYARPQYNGVNWSDADNVARASQADMPFPGLYSTCDAILHNLPLEIGGVPDQEVRELALPRLRFTVGDSRINTGPSIAPSADMATVSAAKSSGIPSAASAVMRLNHGGVKGDLMARWSDYLGNMTLPTDEGTSASKPILRALLYSIGNLPYATGGDSLITGSYHKPKVQGGVPVPGTREEFYPLTEQLPRGATDVSARVISVAHLIDVLTHDHAAIPDEEWRPARWDEPGDDGVAIVPIWPDTFSASMYNQESTDAMLGAAMLHMESPMTDRGYYTAWTHQQVEVGAVSDDPGDSSVMMGPLGRVLIPGPRHKVLYVLCGQENSVLADWKMSFKRGPDPDIELTYKDNSLLKDSVNIGPAFYYSDLMLGDGVKWDTILRGFLRRFGSLQDLVAATAILADQWRIFPLLKHEHTESIRPLYLSSFALPGGYTDEEHYVPQKTYELGRTGLILEDGRVNENRFNMLFRIMGSLTSASGIAPDFERAAWDEDPDLWSWEWPKPQVQYRLPNLDPKWKLTIGAGWAEYEDLLSEKMHLDRNTLSIVCSAANRHIALATEEQFLAMRTPCGSLAYERNDPVDTSRVFIRKLEMHKDWANSIMRNLYSGLTQMRFVYPVPRPEDGVFASLTDAGVITRIPQIIKAAYGVGEAEFPLVTQVDTSSLAIEFDSLSGMPEAFHELESLSNMSREQLAKYDSIMHTGWELSGNTRFLLRGAHNTHAVDEPYYRKCLPGGFSAAALAQQVQFMSAFRATLPLSHELFETFRPISTTWHVPMYLKFKFEVARILKRGLRTPVRRIELSEHERKHLDADNAFAMELQDHLKFLPARI